MESSRVELRRSAAIRVAVAVLAAAGITTLAIVAIWGPLDVKTDVVGYPIFADFNVDNYLNAYYLVIGLFPLLALALFATLTRLGPRLGLAVPPPGRPMRPVARVPDPTPALEADPPLEQVPETLRVATGVGRVAFVAALVGFEVAIAAEIKWWQGVAIGVAVYGLVAAAAAELLRRFWRPEQPLLLRLSAVNSLGALLSVAGLVAVSMSTDAFAWTTDTTEDYPFLPLWLGAALLAALAVAVTIALRRTEPTRIPHIERTVLLLVAAPVCMYLFLAGLPGDIGPIDYFHNGEQLGGSRLVEDGFFPWRDVVLTHGVLQDVVYTFGRQVFEDSVWGYLAGVFMLMKPLYLISVYLLLVYLLGRNWPFLLFAALLLVGSTLAPEQFRMILWPPILLLLATLLDRPRAWKSVLLAFLLVAQAILVPEAAPGIVAVAVVLVAFEWFRREPGTRLSDAFSRTIWVGCAGVGFAALFAIYMAAIGALDDFIFVSRNLVHGHALTGGLPPSPNPGTISELEYHLIAFAPPAALLISFGYAAVRVRLRKGFYTADWVMAAAALLVVFYYPKFLSRMDTGHLYQPFVVALPLMLYILYRAVSSGEGAMRRRWPANPVLRFSAHPISLIGAVVVAILAWGTLNTRLTEGPSAFHPVVTEPPAFERAGYSQVFPGKAYRDVRRVLDARLDRDDRIFDFSNTPALFFYFLDRDPSTRYFQVSLADPAKTQEDIIELLELDPPKLIVFDNDSDPFVGLSNFDGMPTMVHIYDVSEWILDRYRPLLWSHGLTFYARRDQPPPSPAALDLSERPATHDVGFSVQQCTWGSAPNFLNDAALPGPGAETVSTEIGPVPVQVEVEGWAGDPQAKVPAPEVFGTVDGKVVGRVKPGLDRPDLVTFGLPAGFGKAGFEMQLPGEGLGTGPLRIFARSTDGQMSQIVREGAHPQKGSIRIGGREVELNPRAVYGQINSSSRSPAIQFSLPPGSRWFDYQWLEVEAGAEGFRDGTFTVYDRQTHRTEGHEISFQTLDRSPDRYVIPVGSCAPWHAYRSGRLIMRFDTPQDIAAVRLIREP